MDLALNYIVTYYIYIPSRVHWLSGTTLGSNSSLGSLYLGPEIRIPYYGRESSFIGAEARLRPFYSLHKVQEVKRPFNLYLWAELNFGQEPVFLEASFFKLFPEKLLSNYKPTPNLFSASSSVWELKR